MTTLFISHNSEDVEWAKAVKELLHKSSIRFRIQ